MTEEVRNSRAALSGSVSCRCVRVQVPTHWDHKAHELRDVPQVVRDMVETRTWLFQSLLPQEGSSEPCAQIKKHLPVCAS